MQFAPRILPKRERYAFLKWGQTAFRNFSAAHPEWESAPGQSRILGRVVFTTSIDAKKSPIQIRWSEQTPHHNDQRPGSARLGRWRNRSRSRMLGQPVSMLIPQVVGFKLTGKLREGATATDLVLTVTEALRKLGVVGKFVEFYGPGIAELPLATAPPSAHGPRVRRDLRHFPVDEETLRYLRLTGRSAEQVQLVKDYYTAQGLFHTAETPEAEYTTTLSLDLATVEPSVAGPKRPQDRVLLSEAGPSFLKQLPALMGNSAKPLGERAAMRWSAATAVQDRELIPALVAGANEGFDRGLERGYSQSVGNTVKSRFGVNPDEYLDHGSVVIAAITSCTNTSNPSVMIAAGLLAKKAVEKGLTVPPWVKTSLAPPQPPPSPRRVVTDYYNKSGLMPYLEKLRFNVVGYRLHHLHRQFRPTPRRRFRIDQRAWPSRRLSPQRKPQLRGPRQCRRPRQLPHEPARWWSPTPSPAASTMTSPTTRLGVDQEGVPVFLKDIWPSQAAGFRVDLPRPEQRKLHP